MYEICLGTCYCASINNNHDIDLGIGVEGEYTRHTCNQELLAGNFIHQSTLESIILYRDLCGAVSGKGDKPLIKTGY